MIIAVMLEGVRKQIIADETKQSWQLMKADPYKPSLTVVKPLTMCPLCYEPIKHWLHLAGDAIAIQRQP